MARATAEQCARLARRSGRTDRADQDISSTRITPPISITAAVPITPSDRPATPHDRTPAPKTPAPKTPATKLSLPRTKTPVVVATPGDANAGQPTTPTSISRSTGQLATSEGTPRLRPSRSAFLVAAITAVVLVSAGIYLSTTRSSPATPASPPAELAPTSPTQEPTTTPPPAVAQPAPTITPTVAPPRVVPVAVPNRPPVTPSRPRPEPKPRKKPPVVVRPPPPKPPPPKPAKPRCQPRNQINPFDTTTPVCPT